jgi:hypothetical protein
MKSENLDQALTDLREQRPSDEEVRSAAKRVFRNVFDSAYLPERVERIKGCADFQALIPAYLDKSLSAARVSLLKDHVNECVDCRRALREAKSGEQTVLSFAPQKKRRSLMPWAFGAALAAGTAIGITGAFNGLLPGQHVVEATVSQVKGTLYTVSGLGTSLVKATSVIRNAEELRTGKGSGAIFQLVNGAEIEMGERSNVSITRTWRGTEVDVESGRVIVRADKAKKSFRVSAGDLLIPADNSIFAVNRGIKGARVSFAKGQANVKNGAQYKLVQAGYQESDSGYRLVNASLNEEFAWSQNPDTYLALLKEFATLQKQIQNLPSQGLRFSSDLAKYLPANTHFYAAIPNVGGTITEAKRLFDQRLAESEVLRNWWEHQSFSKNGELDRALTQIGAISQYLGDEIVLSMGSSAGRSDARPVFLAKVKQSGLKEYLQHNIPPGADVRFLDSAVAPAPAGKNSLFVSLDDNLVIASPDLPAIQAVMAATTSPVGGGFLDTPFYQRVGQSYANGVGYLLAIDMEQIVPKSVNKPKDVPPGLNNMQYLVLERRDANNDTENRATLSFSGNREGVASWLAAPGPMGSLDFVSPEANFAVSAVIKTPLTVVRELVDYSTKNDPNAIQSMADLESHLGVKVEEDIAAPIGGNATFAIDGPLVPIPSWKVAIEVNDSERLQNTIRTLVDHFNQQFGNEKGRLQLSSDQVESRTFYQMKNDKTPNVSVYYTYVDGYLLAGANETLLLQSIQNREAGITLASSSAFRSQMPSDSFTNFSAIVYHNAGKSLASAADQLKSTGKKGGAIAAMIAHSGPGLICIYGEPDRIIAATKSSFLGFNLGTLAGIEQGKPVLPLIASSAQHTVLQ